jgi:hypothetical protein
MIIQDDQDDFADIIECKLYIYCFITEHIIWISPSQFIVLIITNNEKERPHTNHR